MVEEASTGLEGREDETTCGSQVSSKVTSESYPIAQPLVAILQEAVQVRNEANDSVADRNSSSSESVEVVLETVEDALQNIIRNCFVAMDEMFFYT